MNNMSKSSPHSQGKDVDKQTVLYSVFLIGIITFGFFLAVDIANNPSQEVTTISVDSMLSKPQPSGDTLQRFDLDPMESFING